MEMQDLRILDQTSEIRMKLPITICTWVDETIAKLQQGDDTFELSVSPVHRT